jgi:DNA-binding transcriptional LysR family regulator
VPTANIRVLPRVVQHLATAHPGLQLHVESALTAPLVAKVLAGTLDAAIVTGTQSLGSELAVTTLIDEPLVLVAAKKYHARLSLSLLRARPFIRFEPRTGVGQLINAFLAHTAVDVRESIVLDSLEAIVELVALDIGVAIIPRPEAARYGRGRVVWTENLGRPLRRSLVLVSRRTAGSLRRHEALTRAILATLAVVDGGAASTGRRIRKAVPA